MKKIGRILKTTAFFQACALGGLELFNHRVKTSAAKQNLLKPETGHYFNWKHGKIFYHIFGSGKTPLLLIHDATPYSCGSDWARIQYGLLKKYTTYVIDLPGCGRSDKPAVSYTNYFFVQLISDFIDQVIGQKSAVAASGISSSFALMASLQKESRILELFMIDPESPGKLSLVPDNKSRAVKLLLFLPIIGETIYNIHTSRQNTE